MTEEEFQKKLQQIYIQVAEINIRTNILYQSLALSLKDLTPFTVPEIGSAGDYSNPHSEK